MKYEGMQRTRPMENSPWENSPQRIRRCRPRVVGEVAPKPRRIESVTQLDNEFIEQHTSDDFFKADVRVSGHRHLIFATNQQLQMMANAKTWYIDGTSKLVRKPFHQLLSIHTFVKTSGEIKQFPGTFKMMSRRQKKDYEKVFRSILTMLPSSPEVREMVVDFEHGLWLALHKVFKKPIHGCAFHWGQAVWRQAQSLGLQVVHGQFYRPPTGLLGS